MTTAEQDTPIDVAQVEQAVEAATPAFKFQDTATLPNGKVVEVRLPNQFQHEDISLKASAAQARRMRQMRDPESDSYIVLEAELEDLARDPNKLIEELVSEEWWKDHLEAIKDVQEQEELSTIEEDMKRLEELIERPEDQRPAEEFEELHRHVEKYNDAVDKAREKRVEPRRRALGDRDDEQLLAEVREKRITAEGRRARDRAFTLNELAVGVYATDDAGNRTHRYFPEIDAVETADPETLHILTAAFAALEQQFSRGAVGNG